MNIFIIKILIWLVGSAPVLKIYNTSTENKCEECHKNYATNTVTHPAAESCDNCHQSNGAEHPKSGKEGFTLVEVVPGLCYFCHEPKNTKSTKHPPVDGGECLTCHSPHSSANKFLLTDSPASNLCEMCHDLALGDKKVIHGPVKNKECTECHDPHQSDFENLLRKPPKDLCYLCHEPKNTKSTKHPPVDEGECLTCHSPHGSANKFLLTDSPASNLCEMCHDLALGEKKTVHGPVKNKKCTKCHDPHQSDFENLLKEGSKELCLECHRKTIKAGKRTITNIGQSLKTTNIIHSALEMDGCLTCHDGHASDNNNLLIDKFPSGTYTNVGKEGYSLCFNCHDSQIMETENTTDATGFRNGEKNLHFVHLTGSKSRSCIICHNVHGSENQHLINTDVPFGNWKMAMNYKVSDNGGSCSPGCHKEEKYDRENPIGKIIVTNNNSQEESETKVEEKKLTEGKSNSQVDSNKIDNPIQNIKGDNVNHDEAKNIESGIIKLNSIRFETDSATFNAAFEKDLDKIVEFMKKNPQTNVEIQGYTDNVGDSLYNKTLSLNRAKTAKKRLIAKGIAAERITTVGYGNTKPIMSNDSKKGKILNRRIEFKFFY